MEMKVLVACNIYELINRIPITSVKDKPVRNTLIGNHLKLRKIVKEFESDVQALKEKLFTGHEAQIKEYSDVQDKISSGSLSEKETKVLKGKITPETQSIVDTYFTAVGDLRERNVKVELVPVATDSFVDICSENGIQLSLNDISELSEFDVLS